MTSMQSQTNDVRRVRGLEIGHAAVRMVELQRRGDVTRVTASRCVLLEDRADAEPNWQAAVARLLDGTGGDVGVAIADEAVLYRSLTLPGADEATLAQMIRAQVEATLPGAGGGDGVSDGDGGGGGGGGDVLTWGWMRQAEVEAGRQRVLVAAMRRTMLEQVKATVAGTAAGSPGGEPLRLMGVQPATVAAGALVRRLKGAPLVVTLGAEATTLLWCRGDAMEVATIAHGREHWVEALAEDTGLDAASAGHALAEALGGAGGRDGDALAAPVRVLVERWAGQVAARAHELGFASAPVHLVGLCGDGEHLPAELGGAMGVTVQRGFDWPRGFEADASVAVGEVLPAVGAALEAMEPGEATINLAPPRTQRRRVRPGLVKLAAAAAAWALMAVVLLYAIDRREATRLDAAVATLQQSAGDGDTRGVDGDGTGGTGGGGGAGGGVVRYLEQGAVTPLAVMLELTRVAPESLVLSSLTYEREGQLRLAGKVGSMEDLDELLRAMDGSPAFAQVDLGQARAQNREWEVQLTASLVTVQRYVPPPPEVDEEDEDDGGGEAMEARGGAGAVRVAQSEGSP